MPTTTEAQSTYDPLPDRLPESFRPPPRVQKGLLPSILVELRVNWRLILLCAFGLALLGGLTSLLIKPRFTATASFVPPSGGIGSNASALLGQISSAAGGSLGGSLLGVKSNADLYSSVLKSQTIARRMIEHFHLMEIYKAKKESAAVDALGGQTKISIGARDGIVSVSVTDPDPVRARDMANFYLEALKETSNGMALTENSQRRLFYEDRLRREKDQLANAEVALKQEQERSGLIAPAGQTSGQLQTISQLRIQAAAREAELGALRQTETDENPDVQRVRGELDSLRAQITGLQYSKSSNGLDRFSNAQVPGLALEYVRLEREVKYHETLFQLIAKQYEGARLAEADDPPLQILDRATTPDTKSYPQRKLIAGVCFLLGLIVATFWVLMRATRAGHLNWSQAEE